MKPLEYSHVYVIESLRKGDKLTGTELFNDIIKRRMMQKGLEHQCKLFTVNNKIEFFDALEVIRRSEIFELANPILHFELHGNENGLEISNGEVISWSELQLSFLQLNGICGNNLFVSMATCKGGYIYKVIEADMWTPFWGYLGPVEEITQQEVLSDYSLFFDEFLQSGDFNKALNSLDKVNGHAPSKLLFQNTEYIFSKAYARYEQSCQDHSAVQSRIEEILKIARTNPEMNKISDEEIKIFAKSFILDENKLIKKRLLRRFLMVDKYPEHLKYYPNLL